MSRLFYSLDEAAAKLRKSTEEVMQMARSGQLLEFRDKDQVKFKAADIDQLAGGDDEVLDLELGDVGGSSSGGFELPLSGSDAGGPALVGDGFDLDAPAPAVAPMSASDDDLLGSLGLADSGPTPVLGLADSGAPRHTTIIPDPPAQSDDELLGSLGLADSGPSHPTVGLADSGARGNAASGSRPSGGMADSSAPGMAIADSGASPSPSAGISGDGGLSDSGLNLETVGSGSGLLDMTRDAADESAMGLQLFEEVAADESAPSAASGLFADVGARGDGESDEPERAVGAFGVGAAVLPESVDAAWSGATAGLMIGAAVSLVICLIIAIDSIGGGSSEFTTMIKDGMMMWVGGLGGAVVVFGIAGFFIGRAME